MLLAVDSWNVSVGLFCIHNLATVLTVQRSDAGIWQAVPRLNTKAIHGSATCIWFWSDAMPLLPESKCSAVDLLLPTDAQS